MYFYIICHLSFYYSFLFYRLSINLFSTYYLKSHLFPLSVTFLYFNFLLSTYISFVEVSSSCLSIPCYSYYDLLLCSEFQQCFMNTNMFYYSLKQMHWHSKWILLTYIFCLTCKLLTFLMWLRIVTRRVSMYRSVIFIVKHYTQKVIFLHILPLLISVYFLLLIICTLKAKSINGWLKHLMHHFVKHHFRKFQIMFSL